MSLAIKAKQFEFARELEPVTILVKGGEAPKKNTLKLLDKSKQILELIMANNIFKQRYIYEKKQKVKKGKDT